MVEAPPAQTDAQWVHESWCYLVKESTFLNISCSMFGKWTAKEKLFHIVLSRTVSHEHHELCVVS